MFSHRLHIGSLGCTRNVLRFISIESAWREENARHSATQYVADMSYAKCHVPVVND